MIIYLFPKIIPIGGVVVFTNNNATAEVEYEISYIIYRLDGGGKHCPIRIFKWVDILGMHTHESWLASRNLGTIRKI